MSALHSLPHGNIAHELSYARHRVQEWQHVAQTDRRSWVTQTARRKLAYWEKQVAAILDTLQCEPLDPYAEGGMYDVPGYAESRPSIQ